MDVVYIYTLTKNRSMRCYFEKKHLAITSSLKFRSSSSREAAPFGNFGAWLWVARTEGLSTVLISNLQDFSRVPPAPLSKLITAHGGCNEVVFAEYSKIIISGSQCLLFRNGNALPSMREILQYRNVRSVPLLLKKHNKQKQKKKAAYVWWSPVIY